MTIVNQGNIEEAYFRRKPSSPAHISVKCVRCGITFDKTKYDEKRFSTTGLFDWLFSPPVDSRKGKTGIKTGKRGGVTIGLRSLGNVYRLCVSMNKSETYNGVLIDDIFADYDNATRYMNNLEGNLIIEVTYYCKLHKENVHSANTLNIPKQTSLWTRVLRQSLCLYILKMQKVNWMKNL